MGHPPVEDLHDDSRSQWETLVLISMVAQDGQCAILRRVSALFSTLLESVV